VGIWNEDQLKQLKSLKKKLEQEEVVRESLDRVSEKPKSVTSSLLDDLMSRIASREEGIQYKSDNGWISVPFSEIDKTLFKLAANIGIGPRKMAFGLPRVPVGVSTWLAVSVMISRVAFSKNSVSDYQMSGGHPLWILVASRERSIRDLYLSQRLLFSHQTFIVDQFPIFRFRRDGEIQAISLAHPNKLSAPVLFYHFDTLDFARLSSAKNKIGLILAEISELDSRLSQTMLERLENLRACFEDPKTYIFFNSFDKPLREYLTTKGYQVVDIRPRIPVNERVPALPTALGTFSHYHCTQQVTLEVVPDGAGISQALLDCARDLASVNREIQSNECRAVLAKWWSTWRTLKDLAIPMDTYERYRMHAQGRGSLETAIDRISASADRIVIPEGKVLKAVAPGIRSRLRTIYSLVAQACPKAERFMSLLNIARSTNQQGMLFVLSEKSQVAALREQFLFGNTELLEGELLLVHLARAVSLARMGIVNRCVVPGIWAPWQNSILLAIGASDVTILMYPYEANLVESRIQEHAEECTILSKFTLEKQPYLPILTLTSQQEDFLENLKELSKGEETQTPQWLNTEPQFAFDTLETEDRIADEDLAAGGLLIKFDDGSSVIVRPHSEMMLVTDDGVESVFADVLSAGDVLAIMSDDATRSIFQSVLEQVNHLVKADMKVVELWRASIKKILFEGQPKETSKSVSSIIRSLRKLGCDRTDPAIRQWFKGTTLAPSDTQDINRVLEVAGVSRAADIAKIVAREMNIIRKFNRELGRQIKGQIKASVTKEKQGGRTRLDFEISEAIEAIDYKTIVSKELVQ
jgi:hypothetical protein